MIWILAGGSEASGFMVKGSSRALALQVLLKLGKMSGNGVETGRLED